MRCRSGRAAAIAVSLLVVLTGCAGEETPGDAEQDTTGTEEGPAETAEAAPHDEAADAEADEPAGEEADPAAEAEAADEGAAEAPVGTVTLDGVTVDLDEAFWCQDYESAAGETEMRIVGIAHGAIKLDAGAYVSDEGTELDAVTIWEAEELDRGLGGTQVVAVGTGEDGYPWITVDGEQVSIDGTHQGEDDPDGEEAVFSADLTVEPEPRGSAFC